jgi:hypothetical protein
MDYHQLLCGECRDWDTDGAWLQGLKETAQENPNGCGTRRVDALLTAGLPKFQHASFSSRTFMATMFTRTFEAGTDPLPNVRLFARTMEVLVESISHQDDIEYERSGLIFL